MKDLYLLLWMIELIEEDYDDIQEEEIFTEQHKKDWLGIGDKFWISSSIVPPRNKEFKTTFDYKKKFRANFISTEGTRS